MCNGSTTCVQEAVCQAVTWLLTCAPHTHRTQLRAAGCHSIRPAYKTLTMPPAPAPMPPAVRPRSTTLIGVLLLELPLLLPGDEEDCVGPGDEPLAVGILRLLLVLLLLLLRGAARGNCNSWCWCCAWFWW